MGCPLRQNASGMCGLEETLNPASYGYLDVYDTQE